MTRGTIGRAENRDPFASNLLAIVDPSRTDKSKPGAVVGRKVARSKGWPEVYGRNGPKRGRNGAKTGTVLCFHLSRGRCSVVGSVIRGKSRADSVAGHVGRLSVRQEG